MKTKHHVEKRKVLLFLPLLLWPFLALAFYGLGGGQSVAGRNPVGRLSAELPDASFSGEISSDKMGLYEKAGAQARKDSLSDLETIAGRIGLGARPEEQAQAIQEKLALLELLPLSRDLYVADLKCNFKFDLYETQSI